MQRLQLLNPNGTSHLIEVEDNRAINIVMDDSTPYTYSHTVTIYGEKTAVYRLGTTFDLIDSYIFTPGSDVTENEVSWRFLGED